MRIVMLIDAAALGRAERLESGDFDAQVGASVPLAAVIPPDAVAAVVDVHLDRSRTAHIELEVEDLVARMFADAVGFDPLGSSPAAAPSTEP